MTTSSLLKVPYATVSLTFFPIASKSWVIGSQENNNIQPYKTNKITSLNPQLNFLFLIGL